jgi:hypothetical protein
VRRFFERKIQCGLNVCAALWSDATCAATTTASAKHLTENVAEISATRIEAHTAAGETSRWSHAAHFVVLGTLCCVTDDVICSRDVFELLFSFFVTGVCVGVKLSR